MPVGISHLLIGIPEWDPRSSSSLYSLMETVRAVEGSAAVLADVSLQHSPESAACERDIWYYFLDNCPSTLRMKRNAA